MLRPNSLHCIDAVQGMRGLPPASIPLVVTSPPYDQLRMYGGHIWDWEKYVLVAHELHRVIMSGGILCWVVQDQIKDGDHSLTSFREAIFFQRIGFKVHNVIIVKKQIVRGLQPNR